MTTENIALAYKLLPLQLLNTLYMVSMSCLFAWLIGLPLGIILSITSRGQIAANRLIYRSLEALVNMGRSFPFAILMVAIIPLTRWLVGTSLGTQASIVPLTLAAAPMVARLVESALKEVGSHLLEAAKVMGSSNWQIITKVLLPEALPSLIRAVTLTLVNLISCSAMVGLVGGGGLGQIAIQYGYHRFNGFIMAITVILLLLLVQIVQLLGDQLCHRLLKKRGQALHD